MDFFSAVKGKLIISCQALPDEPLHSPFIMGRMARAAKEGGAVAIRAQSVADIEEIRAAAQLPVIGLIKQNYADSPIYITPTMREVEALIGTGCEMIALDMTARERPQQTDVRDLVARIHAAHRLILADISTYEEGMTAAELGADAISTTMSGYTPYSPQIAEPDYELMRRLAQDAPVPVFAEGRINTPEELVEAMQTGVFGAIVGCAKDDMKKVLAASTMSQIGYMMLGAGLGPIGWAFAIFHLFTHGFFKALMFLGAGSVMHGMNDQVNMRRFGALRTAMKVTWITFAFGWLAILGVPPFSGFFSKDKIIEAAFGATTFAGHEAVWAGWVFGIVTMVGAGITAFYMSRLFFMTFHGTARWTTEAEGSGVHPHESSPLMTVPMIILAIAAAAIGGVLSIGNAFTTWLQPSLGEVEHAHPVAPEIAIQVVTLLLVLAGAGLAWMMYGRREVPTAIPAGNALTRAARQDLYQDSVNEALFMTPGIALVKAATLGDDKAIDGIVHVVEKASTGAGRTVGATQSGRVRTYASYILGGVVLALAAVLAFTL